MSDERKLKRGDIGPDGRVFWCYVKNRATNEWWISREKFDEKIQKASRASKDSKLKNPERAKENTARWKKENKASVAIHRKTYASKNHEKIKQWSRESARRLRERFPDRINNNKSRWNESNPGRQESLVRNQNLRRSFKKYDGRSLNQFLSSLRMPTTTLSAIMELIPNEGQTLAQLIHELSGYRMSVCEEIAKLCTGEFEC